MQVYARIPFQYGPQDFLDRHQIVELRGYKNDEKLLAQRLFLPFDTKTMNKRTCDSCGESFASDRGYTGHKAKDGGCKSREQVDSISNTETEEILSER